MVTKLCGSEQRRKVGLNLAKIHMVTKHKSCVYSNFNRLNLAKIHMVTKPCVKTFMSCLRLNLAKIHMVTKPQTYFNICI